MDDGDLQIRQGLAPVQLLDRRIVPLADAAVEDAVDVVDDRRRRERPRDLHAAFAGGELIGRQRGVARAEVHRPVRDGVDPAAGADRPVGDLDPERGLDLRRPRGDERRYECAARTGEIAVLRARLRRARDARQCHGRDCCEDPKQRDGLPAQVAFLPFVSRFGFNRREHALGAGGGGQTRGEGVVTGW